MIMEEKLWEAEALVLAAKVLLQEVQAKFPCIENEEALIQLDDAIYWITRGVF